MFARPPLVAPLLKSGLGLLACAGFRAGVDVRTRLKLHLRTADHAMFRTTR
jgi:hypothetical protein